MISRSKPITGKQVNLLIARFAEKGIRGDTKILEWIEYNLYEEFSKLEDITSSWLQMILAKLEKEF